MAQDLRQGGRNGDSSQLGGRLDGLYQDYNREDAALDPIQIVRRYTDPADAEVIGFCAAALAFGRVASVLNSIETLAAILGPHPAAFVRGFDPSAPHARSGSCRLPAGRTAMVAGLVEAVLRMAPARAGRGEDIRGWTGRGRSG